MNSLVNQIASTFSVPDAAIRIMFTLFAGYPIAIIYNLVLIRQKVLIKQLYFLLIGLFLGYFNYGMQIFHTTATILGVYLIIILLRPSKVSVGASMIWTLGYLLYGYMYTQGSEYNFGWTIPECVMTLRLIAIVFDIYDGYRIKAGKADIKNDSALFENPTLLELSTACYMPFSFLVGPQFELKRLQDFLRQKDNLLDKCLTAGVWKLVLGTIYVTLYAIGNAYFPISILESKYFEESAFCWKFTIAAIVTKVQCCKYISIWLLAEGSLITSGFTYNKATKQLDDYYNVNVYLFETVTTFGDIINSFNVTTNHWARKYLFKRLKFLGNRFLSHCFTLAFLAIWHGWMSGYYITFVMEFIIMKMEWEVLTIVNGLREANHKLDKFMNKPFVRWPLMIFFHFYTVYFFGYCLISFNLLAFKRYFPVLKKLYFIGHVIYLSWIFISPIVTGYFSKAKKKLPKSQ